jgi:phosphopantetheinyl transferase
VNTANDQVTVLATQENWVKLKEILRWLLKELENPDGIDHKLLEQKRRFLVHMIQTYSGINHYLKGVPGILDYWRRNRDVDGFECTKIKTTPMGWRSRD